MDPRPPTPGPYSESSRDKHLFSFRKQQQLLLYKPQEPPLGILEGKPQIKINMGEASTVMEAIFG